MKFSSGILLALSLIYGLSGCSGEASSSQEEVGPDIAELMAVADQATTLANGVAADAVLRQVDLGRDPVRWWIRFTDAAATQEITVIVPVGDVPIEDWEVSTGISPLIGHQSPGLVLDGLRIGSGKVVQTAAQHWNGCPVRGLTLTGEEGQLVWFIFCDLPEGVVSGSMDGVTGEFVPSLAPPARSPHTATPDCRRYNSAPGC